MVSERDSIFPVFDEANESEWVRSEWVREMDYYFLDNKFYYADGSERLNDVEKLEHVRRRVGGEIWRRWESDQWFHGYRRVHGWEELRDWLLELDRKKIEEQKRARQLLDEMHDHERRKELREKEEEEAKLKREEEERSRLKELELQAEEAKREAKRKMKEKEKEQLLRKNQESDGLKAVKDKDSSLGDFIELVVSTDSSLKVQVSATSADLPYSAASIIQPHVSYYMDPEKDVFDCWFKSGSTPHAYSHYPFKNKELSDKNFPGEFAAEGFDQNQGWGYILKVLSTTLSEKPASQNLSCNGLMLAEKFVLDGGRSNYVWKPGGYIVDFENKSQGVNGGNENQQVTTTLVKKIISSCAHKLQPCSRAALISTGNLDMYPTEVSSICKSKSATIQKNHDVKAKESDEDDEEAVREADQVQTVMQAYSYYFDPGIDNVDGVSGGLGEDAIVVDEEKLSNDKEDPFDMTKKKPPDQRGSKNETIETVDSLSDKRDNVLKKIEEENGQLLTGKNKMEADEDLLQMKDLDEMLEHPVTEMIYSVDLIEKQIREAVEFYSAKLAADRVSVSTKNPKLDKQYVWEGEPNSSSFTIQEETDPEVKMVMRDMGKYLDRWITEVDVKDTADIMEKLSERNKRFMEKKLNKLKRVVKLYSPQAVLNKYCECLWWLDLLQVLCLKLDTVVDKGEQQIRFYTLEMATDPELEPKPYHVIAFENAANCGNLYDIIRTHLNMLRTGNVFIVPWPTKDAFREAKTNGLGVTIVRKGELKLNIDEQLEEVEAYVKNVAEIEKEFDVMRGAGEAGKIVVLVDVQACWKGELGWKEAFLLKIRIHWVWDPGGNLN